MRLSEIKLSGFKSFVDHTSIKLPGNLTGIVGPNGCGKSNTIDAVRWVMGESSAKHLRGESMDDVIFSGSSARKPVGQASVELVFDNSAGKLGGEYAGYSEIAVRRKVTRDGQSQYFLNGTKCRRRDITDIFLGTGLGPRSYAIIEQGMISRLIEAKPEDMRAYLEEAAGISKYKERRRETENRIRHTRDNLDRLNDLREEVEKQLNHLQRQSRAAERYKEYKTEEKQLRAELLGLRWLEYHSALDSFEERLQQRQEGVEQAEGKLETAEQTIEDMRERRIELDGELNDIQGQFYALGAEITRAEQSIGHAREEQRKREAELTRIEEALQEAVDNIDADKTRIEEIDIALAEAGPTRDKVEGEIAEATDHYQQSEQRFQEVYALWEELSAEVAEHENVEQVQHGRAEQLEKNLTDLTSRRERLDREQTEISARGLVAEIGELATRLSAKETEEKALHSTLDGATRALTVAREQARVINEELNESRTELQSAGGRLASLEALQQAALGGSEKSRKEWLAEHNLQDAPLLAQQLDIDEGWGTAIEAVLGDFMDAVCVDDFDTLSSRLAGTDNTPDSGIKALRDNADEADNNNEQMLASMVSSTAGIAELLHGVTVCDSLEEAMRSRDSLAVGESIVTRDGIWMGRHWLCVRPTDENGGVLERQEEIDNLRVKIESLETTVVKLESKQVEQKELVASCETDRDKCQELINARHREVSSLSGKLESARSREEQGNRRIVAVEKELDELSASHARTHRELSEARQAGGSAQQQLQVLRSRMTDIEAQRGEVTTQRDSAREALDQVREGGQSTIVKLESMKSGRESILENLQRVEHQQRQLIARQRELDAEEQPDVSEIDALKAQLDESVARRTTVEASLRAARQTLEKHDQSLREHDQIRNRFQQELTQARDLVQQVNMESQESRVRLKTIDEQLAEADVNREELMPTIPEEATVSEWATRLEALELKIQRLGPINLAAIEEFQEQTERKAYLDEQYEDIIQALETLEEAIAKIDKETRSMFRETFDIVNAKLQELFPRLFGGGQARLELTGEDLLETGVAVMARPPGKRVSSIQLLSGGEKALTAVALVFAFFHLRPSPFCMLDEVDAPLDDANVERFAKMVSEMSSQVQFIFITHNKVTMELSNQL
ncbi:MAG: chromosome segregation protein SMC, partial [Pseudomonadota bacterium]